MAALMETRSAILRLVFWDNAGRRQVVERRLDRCDLRVSLGPADRVGLIEPRVVPLNDETLTLTGHLGPVQDRSTLAERLADAVLEGDDLAAYALADDLLEQRVRPEGFVERAELLAQIARLEKDNTNLAVALRMCEEELEQAEADCRHMAGLQ